MKRITCALLSLFMITPCFANIHIRSEAVESVIKQKIPGQDAQVAALAEYNAQVKKANNAGIPASGIWQVCKAAGWNTQTADGEAKCRDFGNTLMKYATWKFKAVCGDYKSLVQKGTGRCVDDVFSNKVLGGVKVNMLVAPGLAKEYARVKYSDKDLVCSKNYRQTTVPPDDYVQCLSMNKNMAYEFRFDSVTATMDNTINEGTESGVCKIFGLKYSPLGVTLDTAYSKGTSWPAACETTDAKICGKVNESMAKFGRSAKIGTTGSTGNKHSACVITKNAISSPSQLRTAFGIDNYVFKKGGVQLNATQALKTQVCTYVRTTVKSPAITSCDCNDGFTQLYDFSGMITQVDDVLTCKINGKNVDFVFDDLSERNRKIATGGSQGMDCMAAGGTYAGQQCMYLDEKQCKMLAKANLQNCPTCKKVEYKNGVCQLPSGADAIQAQKDQRIALIVGGAVVGVVVTVATAGTAGAPVSAVVFTLVETGGAVMEYNAQVKIDAIADEFLLTSQKCKSASCAEKLVKQNLQRLSNVAGDMQVAERNAVDKELARLVGLLPNDSQLLIDIIGGDSLTDANQKSLFDADSWEPEQVWRAVGVALQMTSIFASVGKWVLTKAGLLAETLPETTVRLTTKAKISRTELQQAVNDGKEIKTSSGKKLVIQLFRRSEEIAETEIRIGKTLDNMFGQKLTEISRMRLQQENLERDFIARNKGMLFHGSATDYKDGTVEALSQAWQIHTVPNAKGLLFADPDFYTVKSYASNGVISASVKDFSNTHISLPIPEKYADKFKDITHGNASITLSDRPRKYGYVYAVKPDGFRSAGPGTYMMIEHDVERIDRIAIPLDTDVIFVREGVFTDHTDARGVMILKSELTDFGDGGLIWKMGQAARNIDNDKNVLKNLQIYEECLEKLAKMIQ